MTKSSLPLFKRHAVSPNSRNSAAFRTVNHPKVPNIHQISDLLFIVTHIFASPVQHHTYPAATIYACLIHEGAIRDDPVNMRDQPTPVGFDTLAHVYNADARGTK